MSNIMRILALDIGQRRIGVAVSDPLGITAQGLETIERENRTTDHAAIKAYCEEYSVERIVYGLPLNMNGTRGKACDEIDIFAEECAAHCGCECVPFDERLTSAMGERVFDEAGLSQLKRKAHSDRVAATVILQGYLDTIKHG